MGFPKKGKPVYRRRLQPEMRASGGHRRRMAVDRKEWADSLTADYGGWLSGFLAEERGFDRRAQWRLGMWGVAAVGSVIVAILASHSSSQLHREQNASADLLARQSEQIQS
eukprot:gene433-616_t